MGMNLGRIAAGMIGGAMKGYGEGEMLDGKQRHEAAMEAVRQGGEDRRLAVREAGDQGRAQLSADTQTTIADKNQDSETMRLGIREGGENQRAQDMRDTQVKVAGMNNANSQTLADKSRTIYRVDEDSGKLFRIEPGKDPVDTGITGAKAGMAKENPSDTIIKAVKESSDFSGKVDWGSVKNILELSGTKYDQKTFDDIKAKTDAAAAAGETQDESWWQRTFGTSKGGTAAPAQSKAPDTPAPKAEKGDMPPNGRAKPVGYEDAVWSTQSNSWVVQRNGKWKKIVE